MEKFFKITVGDFFFFFVGFVFSQFWTGKQPSTRGNEPNLATGQIVKSNYYYYFMIYYDIVKGGVKLFRL